MPGKNLISSARGRSASARGIRGERCRRTLAASLLTLAVAGAATLGAPGSADAHHDRGFATPAEACGFLGEHFRPVPFLCPVSLPSRVAPSGRIEVETRGAGKHGFTMHWGAGKHRFYEVMRAPKSWLRGMRRFLRSAGVGMRRVRVRGRPGIASRLGPIQVLVWPEGNSTYVVSGIRSRLRARVRARRDLQMIAAALEPVRPSVSP